MIYIQSKEEEFIPHHFDAACALYGAEETGQSYRLTSYNEVARGKFDGLIKRKLFVGSTEFMRKVFERVGVLDVRLPRNSNREVEFISLAEALERSDKGEKLFIKPVEIKLVSGLLLDGIKHSCLDTLPPDTMFMAYEPFKHEILSEWRLYVHNHKIVDSRNYSGDFTVGSDYDYADSVMFSNKDSFPCAYTIDIGILSNKENVVVEFNDMWAIGNYGIPNDLYLRLLMDRYLEITAKN